MIGLMGVGLIFVAKTLSVLPDTLIIPGAEAHFRQEEREVLVKNDQQLAELDKLKSDVAKLAERNGGTRSVSAAEILEIPAEQSTISESFLQTDSVENGAGVMWIGEWDPVEGWVDGPVEAVQGTLPIPAAMTGQKLRLITKVNIREDYPARDDSYYRAIPILGVADIDAVATVEEVAPAYRRDRHPVMGAGHRRLQTQGERRDERHAVAFHPERIDGRPVSAPGSG